MAIVSSCWADPRPKRSSPEVDARYKTEGAFIRCANASKDFVADPSGMRFAPYSSWRVLPGADENHRGFRYGIVARNSFGALVAGEMECHVAYDGARWSITGLEVK